MALLAEYAITPDVFDVTSYSSDEVCSLCLQPVREVLLTEGLVRDLRAGEWRNIFSADHRPWHRYAKELLKKLASQGRVVPFECVLATPPSDDQEWCAEALSTAAIRPYSGGIIVTDSVKEKFETERLVAPINRLWSAPWWSNRSPSTRLGRSLVDYQTHLDPVLHCATSIMFIDPHLDPTRHGYRQFGDLLIRAGGRNPSPVVEIHRVCYQGSGSNRTLLSIDEIENRFRQTLEVPLQAASLRVEVFVWDDFHYRHLVSNLVGILMENGFDTTGDPNSITTWARLGRNDRDDVQREFDPASRRHVLRGRIEIP